LLYVSTRGGAPTADFVGVLMTGLAADGGLYVPTHWPQWTPTEFAALAGKSYAEAAAALIHPFVGDCIAPADLARMTAEAYAGFGHAAVAPLRQTGANDWLLELFHGPTLAFKDLAMQLLGRLFDHVLAERHLHLTIIGATSGDTGSAAIEACRGRDNLDIFMLHPEGRVSEVQRRQMTTVADANVHNIAVAGTFDDCQALVKQLFNDRELRAAFHLSAVNSINWARVVAQLVYYVTACVALGATGADGRRLAFAVPTGNFGDVYAGYIAARMGAPIGRLIVATNRNDILARFFASGEYGTAAVVPTISPSMDIQVASNFERLLYEIHERDGIAVAGLMHALARDGVFRVGAGHLAEARTIFDAARADEDETLAAIGAMWRRNGILVDPHTAVGLHAAAQRRDGAGEPMVTLATAHPAKFPDAVERATGQRPALPARLADLLERPERYATLPNDFAAVRAYISGRARR
jgi:threonine synthase